MSKRGVFVLCQPSGMADAYCAVFRTMPIFYPVITSSPYLRSAYRDTWRFSHYSIQCSTLYHKNIVHIFWSCLPSQAHSSQTIADSSGETNLRRLCGHVVEIYQSFTRVWVRKWQNGFAISQSALTVLAMAATTKRNIHVSLIPTINGICYLFISVGVCK